MEVLHDWPDKKCGAILSAIRHAAPDNATVLVVEDLMPEEQSDPRGSTLDVIMLTITGGRERTVDQFNLFEGAGRSLLGCLGVSTADRASSFLRARSDFELNWPTGALRPKRRRLVRRRRWSRPDVLELSMTG
jgi:hypothetical protein